MFLRLKAGNKYRLRLVGRPVRYLQHWEPVRARSPGKKPDGTPICPLIARGHEPKVRYAIWVMDRDDSSRLKIIDFPGMLLERFRDWKNAFNGEEPGGKTGPDFQVEVNVPGGDVRRTRYKATALDRAPWTAEETETFKKGIDGMPLKDKLLQLRREHTPDEILKLLQEKEGTSGGGPSGDVGSAPASQAASNPAPSQPSGDDDDFAF
jgi:hypothetical protein